MSIGARGDSQALVIIGCVAPMSPFKALQSGSEEHNEVKFWSSHFWIVLKILKINLKSS